MPASSSSESAAAVDARERSRIVKERAAQVKSYEQQRKDCYQKFSVNPCLLEARDANNEVLRDLKRQETALNDAKRKKNAAERVKAIDERNSPEAIKKQSEERGRAIEQSKQRAAARELEQAKRAERAAKPVKPPRQAGASPTAPPAPQGKPRAEPVPKLPIAQRPGHAEKVAKSQQAAAAREKDSAERRAKAAQREAKRKKPPSAGLPIPN